jgi:hypothetical protein
MGPGAYLPRVNNNPTISFRSPTSYHRRTSPNGFEAMLGSRSADEVLPSLNDCSRGIGTFRRTNALFGPNLNLRNFRLEIGFPLTAPRSRTRRNAPAISSFGSSGLRADLDLEVQLAT